MEKRDPQQEIPGLAPLTVSDFWAWAFSDVLSNAARGVFAEYIVGAALGVVDGVRREWDAFDLLYDGRKIEVKSTAYVQSWPQQKRLSSPIFSIGLTRGWDAETGLSASVPTRAASVYVFCLYSQKERALADPLNLGHWQFYVLPTAVINAAFGNQKSAALSRIRALAAPVGYPDLRQAIDAALAAPDVR